MAYLSDNVPVNSEKMSNAVQQQLGEVVIWSQHYVKCTGRNLHMRSVCVVRSVRELAGNNAD